MQHWSWKTYSATKSTILDAADGLVLRTYNIRESLAPSTSEHSLYNLGADVDPVGRLDMILESLLDIDD